MSLYFSSFFDQLHDSFWETLYLLFDALIFQFVLLTVGIPSLLSVFMVHGGSMVLISSLGQGFYVIVIPS